MTDGSSWEVRLTAFASQDPSKTDAKAKAFLLKLMDILAPVERIYGFTGRAVPIGINGLALCKVILCEIGQQLL